MGAGGFPRRLNDSLRRPNIFRDICWCRARIAERRIEEGAHLVNLDVFVENQRGETTAKGAALVELP
jgi:hypothetical protein